ncbi:tumor necrosis factor receptor superfamily member 11A-like [Seriola lalandi dorsalis]|uniref:Tumor necrosis factor receptor superfamily member 5 n=1 Tax=Seriola lalandi dorsalis TaxID=1841481 RepID=A0A3B4XAT3_SERLL|nr:tumor necrosis factor receptor superfamily member 11A-like [Seriola lalandi dorsalis]XP_056219694.1 tumor necrosis factor receptor superfamily member 11A isoform X1 [Seriola aureovittata]
MRLTFSTSWIFRGWITCVLVTFYAQDAVSKSLQCDEKHYLKGSRCCEKCEPGTRVFSDCNDSHQTKCVKCSRSEYQPGWTDEKRCLQQKFCDPVKGFMETTENFVSEELCRCRPHLQCFPINCEFCEKIPTCKAGLGLKVDLASTNGRKICVPCKKGFYSADNDSEQCKQWTNCKAEGRRETRPGSAQADAECGPPVSAPSWVVVSVLSVITVLCLLILLLFCYKDKLKLLSVNLRSCVQNLKRTRIQQETLAPLYHSGGPKCTPCETTKLICPAPNNPTDESPCTIPTSVPDVKVSLPFTGEVREKEGTNRKTLTEDQSEGSGEPEEVSEEEEVVSVSPLLAGSCMCVIPVHEPLEVGENEDCSQAVSPGTPGTCSCGGLDGERDGDESGREEKSESVRAINGGEKAEGTHEKMVLCKSETGAASLVSHSPPLLQTSSVVPPSSPLPELCLPLSQAVVSSEFKPYLTDRSLVKQEELYRLASMDPTSTENSTTSVMTSVIPLMTPSSVGDLYLDKSPVASSQEQSQGLSWEDSSGNKFSSGETELECSPESLHSQLAEPTLTSGQVSGNHNTTFISSGQVMNFSGDVIVVYVSQTSVGSDGAGQDDAFGSPVQEEANETAPFFQRSLRSQGDSVSHITLQDETLPVQEVMEERPLGK